MQKETGAAIAHAQASNGCHFEALPRAQERLRREIRAAFFGVAEKSQAREAFSLLEGQTSAPARGDSLIATGGRLKSASKRSGATLPA